MRRYYFLLVGIVALGCNDAASRKELLDVARTNEEAHRKAASRIESVESSLVDVAKANEEAHHRAASRFDRMENSLVAAAAANRDAHRAAARQFGQVNDTLEKTGVSRLASLYDEGGGSPVVSRAELNAINEGLKERLVKVEHGKLSKEEADKRYMPRSAAGNFVPQSQFDNTLKGLSAAEEVRQQELRELRVFAEKSLTRFKRYRIWTYPDHPGWIVRRIKDGHYNGEIKGGPIWYQWKWQSETPRRVSLEALVTVGYWADPAGRTCRRVKWVTVELKDGYIHLPPYLRQFDYDLRISAPHFPGPHGEVKYPEEPSPEELPAPGSEVKLRII